MEDEMKKDKVRLIEVDSRKHRKLQLLGSTKGLRLKVITDDILERGFESFDKEFPALARDIAGIINREEHETSA